MCLEAGDGGVKYDVKRVNLGKDYLGIAWEEPGRFRRLILQGAYSRLQSDEDGRRPV